MVTYILIGITLVMFCSLIAFSVYSSDGKDLFPDNEMIHFWNRKGK